MAQFDVEEGILRLGPSGRALVLITNAAEVEISLESKFDTQKKSGASKARPRFIGFAPAEIDVSWQVMPEEDDAFWRDVAPLLRPKSPKAEAPPLDVQNLQINRVGITKIVMRSSRIGTPNAREGRHVSARFTEWTIAPSDPVLSKPTVAPSELEAVRRFEGNAI